jgi:hypothetical protein
MSAIDHTKVRSIAFVQECVCDVGLCARTNESEFERKPVSTIECTVVHSIPECNFFFFFLQKYLQTQTAKRFTKKVYLNPKLKMAHCPQCDQI